MDLSKSDSKADHDAQKTQEVHSANSWETADLGDTDRNKKFLRLMGASKKEHHGRFVIGDQEAAHKRPKDDEKHIENELTEQYTQGMEHRLVGGRRGHLGLGYHPDEKSEEEKKSEEDRKDEEEKKDNDDKEEKDDDDKEKKDDDGKEEDSEEETSESKPNKEEEEKLQIKDDRKRESEQEGSESEHGIKKMKFVKSSS